MKKMKKITKAVAPVAFAAAVMLTGLAETAGTAYAADATRLVQSTIYVNADGIQYADQSYSIGGIAVCGYSGSGGDVAIPDEIGGVPVVEVSASAFKGCTALTGISLPESVTSIGNYAFYGCSGLTDVYYGGTEAQWGKIGIGYHNECLTDASIHCGSAKSGTGSSGGSGDAAATVDGLTYELSAGKATCVGYEYTASVLTVPETVTVDGKAYPVTAIGDGAFAGNGLIQYADIGKNVRTIGKKAFKGCARLKSIDCLGLTAGSVGDGVRTIKAGAFQGCKALTSVLLGAKVKKIGKNAFKNCKGLTSVTVKSKKLTSVGADAFHGIGADAEIKVPSGCRKAYRKLLRASGYGGTVSAA